MLFPLKTFFLSKVFQERYSLVFLFLLGLGTNITFAPSVLWWTFPFFLSSVLLILERMTSSKKVLWGSFLYYVGFFLGGVWWVSVSLSVDWTRFWWVLPFSLFGIPIILSILFMGTFYFFWRVKKPPLIKVSILVGLTLIIEYVQTYYFPKFPWNLHGYIFSSNTSFLQFVSFVGIFGLTIITLFSGTLIYLWYQGAIYKKISTIFMIFLILIGAWGHFRLKEHPISLDKTVAMRLVQPNIPQKLKWDSAFREYIFEKFISLSSVPSSLASSFSFIIWPESAVPFYLEEEPQKRAVLSRMLDSSSYLITGGARRTCPNPFIPCNRQPILEVWNSLFVVNAKGNIEDSYDKSHLVAFGEYIPFRAFLGALGLKKITYGNLDFSKGVGPKTMTLSEYPSFSPMICYESAFPKDMIDPSNRPQWLLVVTNDAWFGQSTGPYQHFEMARVRAVEEGLPIVRVANTGISAVIDPLGRVITSLPLDEEGIIDSYLPRSLETVSLYGQYGNKVAFLFFFILCFLLGGLEKFLFKK